MKGICAPLSKPSDLRQSVNCSQRNEANKKGQGFLRTDGALDLHYRVLLPMEHS